MEMAGIEVTSAPYWQSKADDAKVGGYYNVRLGGVGDRERPGGKIYNAWQRLIPVTMWR